MPNWSQQLSQFFNPSSSGQTAAGKTQEKSARAMAQPQFGSHDTIHNWIGKGYHLERPALAPERRSWDA